MKNILRGILGIIIFIAIIFVCWVGAAQVAVHTIPEELWIIVAAAGMFGGVCLAFEFAKRWWTNKGEVA
ncbi:MAG: hypothetical protein ACXAC5_04960 [Promethearchaeota archaeon]